MPSSETSAHLAFALDRHQDSLTAFSRMVQLQPQDVKVQAGALLALGRKSEAEAAVQTVTQPLLSSDLAADRAAAADLLCFVGQFDDALASLELQTDSESAKRRRRSSRFRSTGAV
jgi:hypothetical protein